MLNKMMLFLEFVLRRKKKKKLHQNTGMKISQQCLKFPGQGM